MKSLSLLPRSTAWSRSLSVTATLALAACAVGPDFHPPAAPDAAGYTREAMPAALNAAQTIVSAANAPRAWWTQFGCPALDALVDAALAASPTLDAARARLTEARENYAAQAGTTLYPSVSANLSATREKIDLSSMGITGIPSPGPFTLYDASVSVSYVFDLFGANRRALEAMRAQVDYNAYELEAARLSLAGNVVAAAIRHASLRRQIELTQQLIDAQSRQLVIMQARLAAGGVAEIDVHSQRTLLAQTQASLPALETQLAQTDHQLATLLGVPPSSHRYDAQLDAVTLDALHLPSTIALTLPATLARERPDIRASEALLHEASANVGVATANLYPQISLSGSVGSERMNVADVLHGINLWNLGANLTQPLFEGGALRARKRSAQAAWQAALADYRQTVLQSLQQVADALHAIAHDGQTLQSRDDAAREAEANVSIAGERYKAGGISDFALIDTQRQALQTSLDETRARADWLADTAALYQSLGGAAPTDSTGAGAGLKR